MPMKAEWTTEDDEGNEMVMPVDMRFDLIQEKLHLVRRALTLNGDEDEEEDDWAHEICDCIELLSGAVEMLAGMMYGKESN